MNRIFKIKGVATTQTKIYIIHHYDADGYAAAAILKQYLLEKDDYTTEQIHTISANHNYPLNLNKIDKVNSLIYILDYSFTRKDDQIALYDFAHQLPDDNRIIWIDHHASSKDIMEIDETYKQFAINGLVDPTNKWAGCMLTWIYCYDRFYQHWDLDIEGLVPLWIRLIDDHDKWANKMLPDSKYLSNALFTMSLHELMLDDYNEKAFCNIGDLKADEITLEMVKKGKTISEYQDFTNNQKMMGSAFEAIIEIEGEKIMCLCCNSGGNSYLFGDHFEEYDAVIPFYFLGDRWTYSIFSNENSKANCKRIAEYFKEYFGIGGGGHLHAAGWQAPCNIFDYPKYSTFLKSIGIPEWRKR